MSSDVPTACSEMIKQLNTERAWLKARGYQFPALYDAITLALTLIMVEAQKRTD